MKAPQKHRKQFAILCSSCLLVTCIATQGCSSGTQPQPHILSTHAMAHRRLSNTVADISVGIETNGVSLDDIGR